ncbi:MAG: two-component system sensor histidine kinase/response regulator, partial [Phenylobacterium sp.]
QAQPLVTHHYLKGLKAAGDAQPVEIAQPPKPAFAADTRILLVEDNFINQAVAVSLLESHGLSCDLANNGIEALKTLNSAELPYQLILMDCQMPEMDGYETTQQIR